MAWSMHPNAAMEIGRSMKRAIASACLVAVYGAFGAGCSAANSEEDSEKAEASNSNSTDGTSVEENRQVPASSATKEAYGVAAWSIEAHAGATVVQGFDEGGELRLRFEQTVTTDAAGDTHGTIEADIDGAPKFQYTVSADGKGSVVRNDFPGSSRAVDAALAALADFQRGGVDLVRTNGLETKDLTTGNPTLVSGSQCAAAITATMCIIAAMCGLGGDAGASLMASVVEAGTSQECH